MKFLKATLIILTLFAGFALKAQEAINQEVKQEPSTVFCLTGEYRTMGEYREGYKMIFADSLGGEKMNPSILVHQRIRLSANYSTKKFDTKLTVQDRRVWGQNGTALNNVASLTVQEAWLKYKFTEKLALTMGRQTLSYGDGHIIWHKEWNDFGASHDAFTLQYADKNKGFKADFVLAVNGKDENYYTGFGSTPRFYKDMALLFAEKTFGENKVYFIDMLEERENAVTGHTYARNTMGISPELKFGNINLHAGFYLQNGADNVSKVYIDNGTTYVFMHEKMSSYMYTAKAFYGTEKFEAGALYESYSGETYDDTNIDGINHTFTLSPEIWGAHKFLGAMDYYIGGQINTARGINDLGVFVKYGKKTFVNAELHMLSYANEDRYMNGADEVLYKNIGSEIDLCVSHKLSKEAFLKVGYSVMLPGDEHLQKIDNNYTAAGLYGLDGEVETKTAQWVWVMFSFKPHFLKIEK